MTVPLATAQTLRNLGRDPPDRFRIELANGQLLTVNHLLRILPGKRLTGIGTLDGMFVLVKLFIAQRGDKRHWEREHHGVVALIERHIPTPKLLAADKLSGGGHYLLTEFLDGAHSLAEMHDATRQMATACQTLGLMHAHGLVQEDAHLGNFLLRGDSLYVIDGDAIRTTSSGLERMKNLALLLAQLSPVQETSVRNELIAAYRAGNPAVELDVQQLAVEVTRARKLRLADYLGKCLRDCSLFKVEKRRDRFVALVRDEADFLAPIVADPERWLDGGVILKQGRTATLAMIESAGRKLVIKRYNIKNAGHALSRCWRPSRAWHSWVEAHRLQYLGIDTPRPLAMIEQRLGPLRGRAWIVIEYCAGEGLAAHFATFVETGPPASELQAVQTLFGKLADAQVSHGDLKATNLLWCENRLYLIDLDAAHQYEGAGGTYARAWKKDRARFLQNWPEGSTLRRKLESVLPGP
jgi:tRNA A-37 threonylcarbamoyl transferase component Bud32